MQNEESAKGDTCQLNDAISVMSAVGCVIMRRVQGKNKVIPQIVFISLEKNLEFQDWDIYLNISAYLETDLRYQSHKRLLIRVVWGQFQSRQWRSIWRGLSKQYIIIQI